MCRILALRSAIGFDLSHYLKSFAKLCQNSQEFQGHGWGVAYRRAGQWQLYKNIKPIWQDQLEGFGTADLALIHARSAFQNEGIVVENNMPFDDGQRYFIFNGELRGVRFKAEGRIGAEKIFNTIRRFDHGNLGQAFDKGLNVIAKRTRYVRALNVIMTDGEKLYAANHFGEDPAYFTLHHFQDANLNGFCSQPLSPQWRAMGNDQRMVV